MKLSTLAGIVGSDGHLSKSESAIVVVNKDMEFIRKIVMPLLKSLTKKRITVTKTSSGYGDYKYLVRVWDRNLQEKLRKNYGIPRGKKDRVKLPKLPSKDMIDFMLGWIAGDGSVTSDRGKPKIEIWSKDKNLIGKFSKFLLKKKISSSIFSASNERYILRIGKLEDLKRFSRYRIPHPVKARKLRRLLASTEAGFSTS